MFPSSLKPTRILDIKLPSGGSVSLPVANPTFKLWKLDPPEDTYGGKEILEYNGKPVFAELYILKSFQDAGWDGVWIDTFRDKFLQDYFEDEKEVELPPNPRRVYEQISNHQGSRSGFFDVLCWRSDHIIFLEAKQQGNDQIRDSQKKWIESALNIGISIESLIVIEWSVEGAV